MSLRHRFLALVFAIAAVAPVVAADIVVVHPVIPKSGSYPPAVSAWCSTEGERCQVTQRSYTYASPSAESRVAYTAVGQYAFDLPGWADSAFMSLQVTAGTTKQIHCGATCEGFLRESVKVERGSTVVVSGNVYWCDWHCWIRKDYPYATTIRVV
ncbi:MAG TPA: hypothetical protein VM889_04125 [Candidatus Thermoplasmatota archaeon]|nr:hypothetical protein [Candidatus Thermoplasmatota archaeon]